VLPTQEANADSDEEAEDDGSQTNDSDLLEDFPDDTDVRTLPQCFVVPLIEA
jgi:hypothetical protein